MSACTARYIDQIRRRSVRYRFSSWFECVALESPECRTALQMTLASPAPQILFCRQSGQCFLNDSADALLSDHGIDAPAPGCPVHESSPSFRRMFEEWLADSWRCEEGGACRLGGTAVAIDGLFSVVEDESGTLQAILLQLQPGKVIRPAVSLGEEVFGLFEQSQVGLAMAEGPEAALVRCNDRFLDIVRTSTLTGASLLSLTAGGSQVMDSVRDTLLDCIRLNQAGLMREVPLRFGQDGADPLFINIVFQPIDSEGPEPKRRLFLIISDVSRQVASQKELDRTRIALNGSVELARLGTWRLELASGTFTVSQRFREWTGLAEEVVPLETALQAVPERERVELRKAMKQLLEPGAADQYEQEYPIVHTGNGQRRIILMQGRLLRDANGTPSEIVGTAQDVTLHRELQTALSQQVAARTEELAEAYETQQALNEEMAATNEELESANRELLHSNYELSQYAYVASHDLQEPLRKICVFTDILRTDEELAESGRKLVGRISQSANRMSMLIRDLLDFSRLMKTDALMREVNLNQLFELLLVDFELAIEEKNARVSIHTLPSIEGVQLQMNQLFFNLFSNALKFTKPGIPPEIIVRAVPISAEEAGRFIGRPLKGINYYHLTFTDNGIGFETEYSEQIFEVFKRLHGKDQYPGSGIGLAMCRRIAANHNAHLFAVSNPGYGTTFHFIFPDRQKPFEATIPDHFTWENTHP